MTWKHKLLERALGYSSDEWLTAHLTSFLQDNELLQEGDDGE